MTDLKEDVVKGLSGRTVAQWKAIATEAGVSESMVAQLGRGNYKSSPTYTKLRRIAEAVAKFPRAESVA